MIEDRAPAGAGAATQVFVEDVGAPRLQPADGHHLDRVLRLQAGEQVVAADGRGTWRLCRYVGRPEPALEPVGDPVYDCAPEPPVTVAFVPVKGERPEWVVQKLTEIGVDRMVVLRSARSVVRWDRHPDDEERALGRLRRVVVAASAQSRRAWIPTVEGIVDVAALAGAVDPGSAVLAERGGSPIDLARPVVAVGPEGGWDQTERQEATGGLTVDLGPTVLRAETAALVAGTLLCALRSGTVAVAGQGCM